ncbi:MAG TPA: acyl-CoA desaturase [Chitinophagaceae bacterium]|nr:acyl-CoA desaturase [Chitinophagaceae bacterium]
MKKRFAKYQPHRKSDFYKTLQKEVYAYLNSRQNTAYADQWMLLKIAFCLGLFIVAYSGYISSDGTYATWLAWCLLLGFASFLVGVNIGHDAVHRSLFKTAWLNRLAGFSFDLIGISSYMWRLKHNVVHHRFPNVTEVDYDIEAGPILRLSPAEKRRWFHAWQHWYAPLVYIFFSFHLILANDVKLLAEGRKKIDGRPHPAWVYAAIPLLKISYLFYMIVLPIILLPFPWWKIVLGYVLMQAALCLVLALVLLPSHLFEHTEYKKPSGNNTIHDDWAMHQLSSTLDFASKSRLANFLFGGFNTNVVHHLFPKVCHIHHVRLVSILEQRAGEFNVPYHRTSFMNAVRSHFKALKRLGNHD